MTDPIEVLGGWQSQYSIAEWEAAVDAVVRLRDAARRHREAAIPVVDITATGATDYADACLKLDAALAPFAQEER